MFRYVDAYAIMIAAFLSTGCRLGIHKICSYPGNPNCDPSPRPEHLSESSPSWIPRRPRTWASARYRLRRDGRNSRKSQTEYPVRWI